MTRLLSLAAAACVATLALPACEDVDDVGKNDRDERRGPTEEGVTRTAAVKTSVLLLPLAKKAADDVDRAAGVEIDIQAIGSNDALAALCAGQTEVALANRRMTRAERELCTENGIEPVPSFVAHQVVALYKHENLEIECLTVEQLRSLWRPGSEVKRYSDLGSGLPDVPVRLITYPPRSAAFEFFARRITGAERPLRDDARRVTDRLRFADVVRSTPGSLAFAPSGLAVVDEERLRPVAVDAGGGCVRPSADNVQSGAYETLSAPLYMYSTRRSLREPSVKRFVDYILDASDDVAGYPGLVPPDPARQPEAEPRP